MFFTMQTTRQAMSPRSFSVSAPQFFVMSPYLLVCSSASLRSDLRTLKGNLVLGTTHQNHKNDKFCIALFFVLPSRQPLVYSKTSKQLNLILLNIMSVLMPRCHDCCCRKHLAHTINSVNSKTQQPPGICGKKSIFSNFLEIHLMKVPLPGEHVAYIPPRSCDRATEHGRHRRNPLKLRGLHLLVFLTWLVVSVLGLQLPGAFVRPLVVVSPDFLHDFFQICLVRINR